MIQWVGFKKKYVPYVVEERRKGVSKYTVRKLAGLVLSGVTSFSAFPLRLAFWLGNFVFIASFGLGVYFIFDHYLNPDPFATGFATLVVLLLFLGSLQLMIMGIFGEYMYKMYNEIKGRPFYIVYETRNIEKENVGSTPYGIHNL